MSTLFESEISPDFRTNLGFAFISLKLKKILFFLRNFHHNFVATFVSSQNNVNPISLSVYKHRCKVCPNVDAFKPSTFLVVLESTKISQYLGKLSQLWDKGSNSLRISQVLDDPETRSYEQILLFKILKPTIYWTKMET